MMPDYSALVSLVQFFDQFDSIPLFALGMAMAWYLNISIKNHREQIELKHPSKQDFDKLKNTINETKDSITTIATQNAVIQNELKNIKETLKK